MTINEVTTRYGGLAPVSDDPYLDYGIEAATAGASFLKFDRNGAGFSHGIDSTPVPLGTRMAANMAGLRIGWVKWSEGGGKPEKILVLMSEGRKVSRDDLGDNDKMLWKGGKDPWVEGGELDLVDGQGQQYIYTPTSFGGVKAIKKLCYDYARERRARPGQLPIVELGQHWYPHPKFSKVWEPELNIVGWANETTLEPAEPGASELAREPGEDALDDIPFEAAPSAPAFAGASMPGASPQSPTSPSPPDAAPEAAGGSKNKANQGKNAAPRF